MSASGIEPIRPWVLGLNITEHTQVVHDVAAAEKQNVAFAKRREAFAQLEGACLPLPPFGRCTNAPILQGLPTGAEVLCQTHARRGRTASRRPASLFDGLDFDGDIDVVAGNDAAVRHAPLRTIDGTGGGVRDVRLAAHARAFADHLRA